MNFFGQPRKSAFGPEGTVYRLGASPGSELTGVERRNLGPLFTLSGCSVQALARAGHSPHGHED